jgi:hypothetical protein
VNQFDTIYILSDGTQISERLSLEMLHKMNINATAMSPVRVLLNPHEPKLLQCYGVLKGHSDDIAAITQWVGGVPEK